MSRASLQRRLLLGAVAWIVLALIATGVLLSVLFRNHLEDELARRLDADFLQLVSQLEPDVDGRLTHTRTMSDPLYQRVLSGHYWQVERDGRPVLRSRSLWEQSLALDAGNGALQRIDGPRDTPMLVVARRVTMPRMDAPLRLAVAASLAPVERAVAGFRRTLAIALGLLALGLVLAAALQVRLGLRPLRRLRAELGAIRSARAARLSVDYPGEVAPLVEDLNGVLAHNETLIERARRQAGHLAHALKTPLSVIANEAARLQRRGDAERGARLQQEVDAMQRQIDWHLARTRIAGARRAGQATPVAPVLERLQRALQRLHGERSLVIESDTPAHLAFAGESQDLEQMLGNLLENACKWAHGVVSVAVTGADGAVVFVIDDDGPGLDADQRERAIQLGTRFDEKIPGSGLGLAIVTDLAAAYDGSLALGRSAAGGLSATLRLPAARTS